MSGWEDFPQKLKQDTEKPLERWHCIWCHPLKFKALEGIVKPVENIPVSQQPHGAEDERLYAPVRLYPFCHCLSHTRYYELLMSCQANIRS